MKLEKSVVNRRVDLLSSAGVKFCTGVDVGRDTDPIELKADYDALLLATGATRPRDLSIPGRDLNGVHFAMDFLTSNTRSLLDSNLQDNQFINAKDLDVIVIGGGDTGADCIGTALRHGCRSLINLELLGQPPVDREPENPWPNWPLILRTDYAHEETISRFGSDPRTFSVLSKQLSGDNDGKVTALQTTEISWTTKNGRSEFAEISDTGKTWNADLVLLAMGFLGPETYVTDLLGVELDSRSNYLAKHGAFQTSVPGVFAAGDCRRGQSLVVWAINEGRGVARSIDQYLMGSSVLPAPENTMGSSVA